MLVAVLVTTGGVTLPVAAQQPRPANGGVLKVADAELPVAVEDVSLRTQVIGTLARTSVHMTFRNPNARVLEGQLELILADGQQVAGFALDVGGELRDAVPVAKTKGRAVFEAIERRGIDPALLEQKAGNRFELRVYPLPAGGTRQVRIDLDQTLSADAKGRHLRMPLAFAAGASRVRWMLDATGADAPPKATLAGAPLEFSAHESAFEADLAIPDARNAMAEVILPRATDAQVAVTRFGDERYFVADVPVTSESAPRPAPKVVGLLWDASLSARNRDIDAELALLERYLTGLDKAEVRLTVLRDRAATRPDATYRMPEDWPALRDVVKTMPLDGATALNDWTPQNDVDEYLLFSDGYGDYGVNAVFPALKRGRLMAIHAAGANADPSRLRAIAEARRGQLLELRSSADATRIADVLRRNASEIVSVGGEGIADAMATTPFVEDSRVRVVGRLTATTARLRVEVRHGDSTIPLDTAIPADAMDAPQAATLWARTKLAAWAADPEAHRDDIAKLGERFRIPTGETSLIVLENASDYVQYDIAPPASLEKEVARLARDSHLRNVNVEKQQLDRIAAAFAERIEWWEKTFPKEVRKQKIAGVAGEEEGVVSGSRIAARTESLAAAVSAAPPPPPPAPSAPTTMSAAKPAAEAAEVAIATGGASRQRAASSTQRLESKAKDDSAQVPTEATIRMQPWQPDSPLAQELRGVSIEKMYERYLAARETHAESPAFYLDVGSVLIERGQKELGLRVLSNVAELRIEDRHVLRVLAYRLMHHERYDLAVPLLERVARLAPDEPQSFRDLGLAYAALGQSQRAIDTLYAVVRKQWDGRFNGIDLIALGELNRIVARPGAKLDTSAIDRRLLKAMPLDLRVVLSWDSNDSDMDLWVTDPNGEKCYYSHRLTRQGGLMSNDFTGGYGPEEFVLRKAMPGTYKVEANFYGDRQQIVTGGTTLDLRFFTGYGTPTERMQAASIRLKQRSETVLVGEFEVK